MANSNELPCPYNHDLSAVLRGINRRTPASRAKVANDPVTKAYLAAGMRLIQNQLGPESKRDQIDPNDDNSVARPIFAWISQRAVVAEVANNPSPFPRQGNTSTLRSTWRSHSDYIADLMRFALWERQYLGQNATGIAAVADKLVEEPNFVDNVHEVCYWDYTTNVEMPTFRLQILATTCAEGDPVVREVIGENYQAIHEAWKPMNMAALRAHGLQLRPGITADEFGIMLSAALEGLCLRAYGDANTQIVDHERRRSLFGTIGLALIAALTERADGATGQTIEEHVRSMVYDPISHAGPASTKQHGAARS